MVSRSTALILAFSIGFQSIFSVSFAEGPAVTYNVISNNRLAVSITLDKQKDLANADAAVKSNVANLFQDYKDAATTEQQVYDAVNRPGVSVDPVTIDTADDYRVLSGLKAEARFFDSVVTLTRVMGFTAVGSAMAVLATELREAHSMPAGRAAYVVAALGAAVSLGATSVLEEKSKALKFEISQVEDNIRLREQYLFAQMDYGGDPSVLSPPTCLFKTTCVDSEVCTTNGLGSPKSCTKVTDCFPELLTCRD